MTALATLAPIESTPAVAGDFYARLPVFEGFAEVMEPARYKPLPGDWLVAVTDVVASSEAIAGGRYKAVNTAGASVISAVANALGQRPFPFVFGGDGASLAVPADSEATVREALAATAAWVRDELALTLRAALVSMATIRAQGSDISVARFAPSANVSYAMFAGGGLAWLEREMKAGHYALAPASPGTRPDLTGLSCRWNDIPATRGVILSLVVAPVTHGDPAFRRLVEAMVNDLDASPDVTRPVPDDAPPVGWPPPGLELEARASRRKGEGHFAARLRVLIGTLIAYLVMRFNLKVGGFDPARYKRQVVENSDFRKYDDNLRMTLDCTPAVADRIERQLGRAAAEGIARFGMHRQASALMTCIVPSATASDHFHFVDGAAGGYALAAKQLKQAFAAAAAGAQR